VTAIILPPLPPQDCRPYGHDRVTTVGYTVDALRTRDIEVAKLVLEGAIGACSHLAQADAVSHLLRKLEVKHHE